MPKIIGCDAGGMNVVTFVLSKTHSRSCMRRSGNTPHHTPSRWGLENMRRGRKEVCGYRTQAEATAHRSRSFLRPFLQEEAPALHHLRVRQLEGAQDLARGL